MKFFLSSKTIWGLLIMVAGIVLGKTGITLPEEFKDTAAQQLADIAPLVIDAIGAIVAAYGRAKATQPLSMTRPWVDNITKPSD